MASLSPSKSIESIGGHCGEEWVSQQWETPFTDWWVVTTNTTHNPCEFTNHISGFRYDEKKLHPVTIGWRRLQLWLVKWLISNHKQNTTNQYLIHIINANKRVTILMNAHLTPVQYETMIKPKHDEWEERRMFDDGYSEPIFWCSKIRIGNDKLVKSDVWCGLDILSRLSCNAYCLDQVWLSVRYAYVG